MRHFGTRWGFEIWRASDQYTFLNLLSPKVTGVEFYGFVISLRGLSFTAWIWPYGTPAI